MTTCRGNSKVQDSFGSRLNELLNVLPKFHKAASSTSGSKHAIKTVEYPLGGQYQDALEPCTSGSASPRVVVRLASLGCALTAALQEVNSTLQPRQPYESQESSASIYYSGIGPPTDGLETQTATSSARPRTHRTEWQLKRKLSLLSVRSDEAGANDTPELTGKVDVACFEFCGSPTLSLRRPASTKQSLARPLPFLDVGEDCAIHRWAKAYSIPFAAVSLGTSYFMRLAKVDPILHDEAHASPDYAAFMREFGSESRTQGYPVIGESIGYDVHGQQGMETWLLAVHLACTHVACRVIGTVREAGLLAQMLTDLHGSHITLAQASQLEQQIMVTMQEAF
eukprot:jgi/Botrbrau1/995/Bobra.114_1s0033.1